MAGAPRSKTTKSAKKTSSAKKSAATKKAPATTRSRKPAALKKIDERIRDRGDWRAEILARMRALILEADPEMIEERKWKKPSNAMTGRRTRRP
jgi:hypothetical protein